MNPIKSQYITLKPKIDQAIAAVLNHGQYINGPEVDQFARALETYLGVKHVIPCGNGTDALQIAMMALGLKPADEVIVPAFTYIAPAEVIALLGLKVVWADVDEETFNINPESIIAAITPKTKAIVAVHLFGQCADMDAIMEIAEKHQLFVIEDNAQSLGAKYTFKDGRTVSAGCMGHIGTTSFFPTKNLACCGDGGAMMTDDDTLAQCLKRIANHGQSQKYHHDIVGVNSRLDTIQAAILLVKLPHLEENNQKRAQIAEQYDQLLQEINYIDIPVRNTSITHVFHQYTIKVKEGKRDQVKAALAEQGVQTKIYYPMALHQQKVFAHMQGHNLHVSESLCKQVLSLPIFPDMEYIKILNKVFKSLKAI